ncbi:MAG: lysine--tRNA ligase [Legionellales bacterium]|nr:lysine--tRNA ligase [Legionellales bacterium]
MTETDNQTDNPESQELDENQQIALRKQKLQALRDEGVAFPNDFRPTAKAKQLHDQFGSEEKQVLDDNPIEVRIAGRIMTRRLMGKASFIHIQDTSGRIQAYIRQNDLPDGLYDTFKSWDLGDIVGISGRLFKTKVGELSVWADDIRLITKALRPLPDKYHGLADQETKYRQRYLDLIANDETKQRFIVRSKIVDGIRHFLTERDFLEVETPMMQVLAGGAAAKPFVTRHNTLDMELYLRIAPELYLKRLVVGGFDRVFEINRNFRNEGLSTRHNPEFTMLEFYQAYADYKDLIELTEQMLRQLAQEVLGTTTVHYQGEDYDLSQPFVNMTLREAVLHHNPDITEEQLDNLDGAKEIAKRLQIPLKDNYGLGKIQLEIFEKTVEERLLAPTFITEYPAEVSPLARRKDSNPFVTDRFEFFVAGREIANGFSELNDPEDQAERFRQQVAEKAAGDEEAMMYDEDYVRALEHGMPPTAGEGIGIDRLVMFFTDSPSIRDVILFPHMRQKD